MIGAQLAHFRITAELGAGGMGEVYQAEDTKLGRAVAIKVLPAAFTLDPERLARFQREAKVLASLNHSNIAGIFEVGMASGVQPPGTEGASPSEAAVDAAVGHRRGSELARRHRVATLRHLQPRLRDRTALGDGVSRPRLTEGQMVKLGQARDQSKRAVRSCWNSGSSWKAANSGARRSSSRG